ncbi:hypothetical protein [Paenibacillus validus]|uniref:hypothetical protein n=1 Tax=Paenibacillus validus TaxID=44253 RepID=UPI003D2A5E2A
MNEDEVVKAVRNIFELHKTILASFIPDEARQHFHSSRREALLGMKAILQREIDRLDEQTTGETHQEKSSRSIEITS